MMRFLYIFILIMIGVSAVNAKNNRLSVGDKAPEFSIVDVHGIEKTMSDFEGKTISLSFRRYSACPICNARTSEIEENAQFFRENNVLVIHVYESSRESIAEYLGYSKPYIIMLPDPSLELYKRYGVEQSNWKTMKGVFSGSLSEGNKEFENGKPQKDGNSNRIPADFLIDSAGVIKVARYQKYLGDEFPIEEINREILTIK